MRTAGRALVLFLALIFTVAEVTEALVPVAAQTDF